MYQHKSQSLQLLRLYIAMEASQRHLDHSQELAWQAMILLNEADALRQRVKASLSPAIAPPLPVNAAERNG